MHFAVDFRRVGLGAAGRAGIMMMLRMWSIEVASIRNFVRTGIHPRGRSDVDRPADLRRKLLRRDAGGERHQRGVALLLDLLRHRVWQGVRRCALDRLEAERADAVELGFLEPVEKILEVGLGLAGEADDEGRADRDVRADRAPASIRSSTFASLAGRFIALSTVGEACWNGMSR